MSRAAWIASVFTEEAIARLRRELGSDLPGPEERDVAFLERAGEAIDEYRKFWGPMAADAEARPERLERFRDAARAFAAAARALDSDTLSLLEQTAFVASGGQRMPDARAFRQAIETARTLAAAADRLLPSTTRRPGRPSNRPLKGLLMGIVRAWAGAYGVRPSGARGGPFARVVHGILEAGAVPVDGSVSEAMLSDAIARIGLSWIPAPKTGRRQKKTTT